MDFSEFIKKIKVSDRWLGVDFLAILTTAGSFAYHGLDTPTLVGVGAIAALTATSNHFFQKETMARDLNSCKDIADILKKEVSVKHSKKFWLVYDRKNDSWSKKNETEYKIWKKAICEKMAGKKPIVEIGIDKKSFLQIFECRQTSGTSKFVDASDEPFVGKKREEAYTGSEDLTLFNNKEPKALAP
jgi:hypothetical protein